MLLRSHTRKSPRRGAAMVELTAVLPLFIILLLGIWDVSRMAQLQQIVSNAVREGGRQASTGRLTNMQTRNAMVQYLVQSGLNVTGVTTQAENMTRGGDFTDAERQDLLRVRLDFPYRNGRWNVLDFFFDDNAILSREYRWENMSDLPIAVDDSLPTAPWTAFP